MSISVNSNLGGTAAGIAGGTLTIKNTRDSSARVQSMSRGGSSKSKKKLNYNSREISAQLMRASKSRNASSVLARAKNKVSHLQRCLGTGQYDDGEVRVAIAHAKRMVKCAQSKVQNLKEEETLERKYEKEKAAKEQQQKSEVKRRVHQKEQDLRQKMATEEIQQMRKEKAKRQEIMRKRRLHRNQERGKISEADMKYLKDTIDYMHNSGQIDTTAVSLALSETAVMMSELQQVGSQIESQIEVEVDSMNSGIVTDAGNVTTVSSGEVSLG
ncbi:MAG: hypothetical protein ACI4ES_00160 [Roseburia sp.]